MPPLSKEDFGLDLIMNTSKLAKKQDGLQKNHVHTRLMKSFQILEGYIVADNDTAALVNEFAMHFEKKIPEIIATFHKERIGKFD
jgi:hypothetical protein